MIKRFKHPLHADQSRAACAKKAVMWEDRACRSSKKAAKSFTLYQKANKIAIMGNICKNLLCPELERTSLLAVAQ